MAKREEDRKDRENTKKELQLSDEERTAKKKRERLEQICRYAAMFEKV